MTRRVLPIGIQTLRDIHELNCYYVDKTAYAVKLATEGKHYFLSRPRRFGKSLFVDTLKELFEGNRTAFKGLHAYECWDWTARHPVIQLDFSGRGFSKRGALAANLTAQLRAIEEAAGFEPTDTAAPERFDYLLRKLRRQSGQQVVVLVDEYDKPILDALEQPELARANREDLRDLYSTIKAREGDIRFSFLTGVSKFSKVSLFSGLNNLRDITLSLAYSAICGFTEEDLDTVFEPELPGLDRQRIRDWYNGYGWGGTERVYNPFDVLLLFADREFRAWWFETGTPRFLTETLVNRTVYSPALEGMHADVELLSNFDVDEISTAALLFQAGYLTILNRTETGGEPSYQLGYPNREVRKCFNEILVRRLVGSLEQQKANSRLLESLLVAADFAGLEEFFRSVLAMIPYEWHLPKAISSYEGYYASVVYSYLAGLDLDVTAEDSSSHGRVDMAVRAGGQVYLFEFKVLERSTPGAAMAQLKERRYAEKYRHLGEPVHLVAMEFSEKTRNVASFETELA